VVTYPQTITNPGAETGNTSGCSGSSFSSSTLDAKTGSRSFRTTGGNLSQTLTVDAARYDAIDHGRVSANLAAYAHYHDGGLGGTGTNTLSITFYSLDGLLLGNGSTSSTNSTWTQLTATPAVPGGTRTIVISASDSRTNAAISAFWDDFTLDLVDSETDNLSVQARAIQAVAYAVATFPSAEARATQIVPLTVSAAETSNGNYLVKTHQVVAYALVKGKVDRVDLRAWAFLQDDHLFYGLQLGSAGTIVYDILTQQWCQWYSPGFTYFRCEDVTDWEGYNLGCDTENGTVWKIDPTGRLDNGDTVITSQCTGMVTVRMRENVPCYMAELAVSEANPAASSGTSIQLRTSDDATGSWLDHGTVNGEAVGTSTLFRWYGMGLMHSPGRVFEITNVGYCRRIDALMIEAGGRA
jgi:hypothetical protein